MCCLNNQLATYTGPSLVPSLNSLTFFVNKNKCLFSTAQKKEAVELRLGMRLSWTLTSSQDWWVVCKCIPGLAAVLCSRCSARCAESHCGSPPQRASSWRGRESLPAAFDANTRVESSVGLQSPSQTRPQRRQSQKVSSDNC